MEEPRELIPSTSFAIGSKRSARFPICRSVRIFIPSLPASRSSDFTHGCAASHYPAASRCSIKPGYVSLSGFGIGALSGGTRQRLGLALLLLPDAPVLLLDEPGLSLDPTWRKRLQKTLRFEAERGKAVLVTTHLIAEWNNIAHRCLLCRDGKIERELDPKNLPHNFDELETGAQDAAERSTINEPRFSIVG